MSSEALIAHVQQFRQRRERIPRVEPSRDGATKGLSREGHFAIIAHAIDLIGDVITDLESELVKESREMDVFSINACIASAAVQLTNVLDMVACFCNSIEPTKDSSNVYFRTFSFILSATQFIEIYKRQIQTELLWEGKNFFEIANQLKHQLPYLGMPQISEKTGTIDVWDGAHCGIVFGVLVRVYQIAATIVCRLNANMALGIAGLKFRNV